MEFSVPEALRYLGASQEAAPEALRQQVDSTAAVLTSSTPPRYVYKLFPLLCQGEDFLLPGTSVRLSGRTARTMLTGCTRAALLACTLGASFDRLLCREQAADMARAVVLDACGSAWVEAGCRGAEAEIAALVPEAFLTPRFSPGYGDLPLSLQGPICAALDATRRIGLHVEESCLLNPLKSVTALIGISDRPLPASRGSCRDCLLHSTCTLRKGGLSCAP